MKVEKIQKLNRNNSRTMKNLKKNLKITETNDFKKELEKACRKYK